ncbi:MAG: DNA-3-methyladenine glycosylase 2 family protein [Actinomycetota bacterium]
MLVHVDPATNLRLTLSAYRFGSSDPTTQLSNGQFWRSTHTPIGPATLHLTWHDGTISLQAWGPGADWMINGVNELIGAHDTGLQLPDAAHPKVVRAHRNHPGLRIGASRTLYHELLPTILGQRVTAAEAIGQWRRLCGELGDPAPGPNDTLRLPPHPERILGKPAWWYHPFGIEAKRAEALRTVARHAARIEQWSTLPTLEAAQKLQLLRGIGPWTIGSATAHALGDPDAVPVGDFHIPNMVCWVLADRPRGTDSEMLDLLEPYRGQRGRVIRLLGLDGNAAPKFGPRQRIQPMHQR